MKVLWVLGVDITHLHNTFILILAIARISKRNTPLVFINYSVPYYKESNTIFQMISIKTPKDIAIMKEGGRKLALVLSRVVSHAKAGISIKELDALAQAEILAAGADPLFLGYRSSKKGIPYPATLWNKS